MPSGAEPLEIELMIAPGTTLLIVAAVIEPLRAANRVLGRSAFRWKVTTPDGAAARTETGVPIASDGRFAPEGAAPLFVAASYNVDRLYGAPLIRALGAARRRPYIAGLEAGAWLLARAGLLDGRRATTHWEDLEAFETAYPEIDVVADRFVIDGPRLTAGGALPTMDLMLELIRRSHGYPLALEIAKLIAYDPARPEQAPSLGRLVAGDARVAAAVAAMESHVEDPLSMAQIAEQAGIGLRQLETLFRRTLGEGPKAYYLALRLGLARRMLIEGRRPALEIAGAAGFNSPAAFSRAYRARFGESPAGTRRRMREVSAS